ncbi:hypothetical protein PQ690_02355 [Thermoanaerobacterium thermosaccharolyticum]
MLFNRWSVLFEVFLTSCMRPEEALGLKWEGVDFKNNKKAERYTVLSIS